MVAHDYSLAAWRKYREEQEQPKQETPAGLMLADIPSDAEMDDGIVIGFWNGERFVAWEQWLATVPITVDPALASPELPEASAYRATCGSTQVWLRKDVDRWLMYAGSRRSRRKDFASPYLAHAVRTAEAWYGPPAGGWQVEHER